MRCGAPGYRLSLGEAGRTVNSDDDAKDDATLDDPAAGTPPPAGGAPSAASRLKAGWKRAEPFAAVGFFLGGFAWDYVTLNPLFALRDAAFPTVYLALLIVSLTVEQRVLTHPGAYPRLSRHAAWITYAGQFFFGCVLSAFAVLTFHSARWLGPPLIFVLSLGVLMAINEFLQARVRTVWARLALLWFCVYLTATALLPLAIGHAMQDLLGPMWIVASERALSWLAWIDPFGWVDAPGAAEARAELLAESTTRVIWRWLHTLATALGVFVGLLVLLVGRGVGGDAEVRLREIGRHGAIWIGLSVALRGLQALGFLPGVPLAIVDMDAYHAVLPPRSAETACRERPRALGPLGCAGAGRIFGRPAACNDTKADYLAFRHVRASWVWPPWREGEPTFARYADEAIYVLGTTFASPALHVPLQHRYQRWDAVEGWVDVGAPNRLTALRAGAVRRPEGYRTWSCRSRLEPGSYRVIAELDLGDAVRSLRQVRFDVVEGEAPRPELEAVVLRPRAGP